MYEDQKLDIAIFVKSYQQLDFKQWRIDHTLFCPRRPLWFTPFLFSHPFILHASYFNNSILLIWRWMRLLQAHELMIKNLKLSNVYLPSLPQTADGRMEGWTEQNVSLHPEEGLIYMYNIDLYMDREQKNIYLYDKHSWITMIERWRVR